MSSFLHLKDSGFADGLTRPTEWGDDFFIGERWRMGRHGTKFEVDMYRLGVIGAPTGECVDE